MVVDLFLTGDVDRFLAGDVDRFLAGEVDRFLAGDVDRFLIGDLRTGDIDRFLVGEINVFLTGDRFFNGEVTGDRLFLVPGEILEGDLLTGDDTRVFGDAGRARFTGDAAWRTLSASFDFGLRMLKEQRRSAATFMTAAELVKASE